MTTVIRVKGWDKFQHFKDRRPPWIKLYRDILDDIEWHELDPVAAKALVMIWLIASESDGVLPDVRKLSFRLRMAETEVLDVVSNLSHWLDQVDINAISDRYQSDLPERETERETETEDAPPSSMAQAAKPSPAEDKKASPLSARQMVEMLPGLTDEVAGDYLAHRKGKRSPLTASAWKQICREVTVSGWAPDAALSEAMASGWQGVKADWLASRKNTAPGAKPSENSLFAGCQ